MSLKRTVVGAILLVASLSCALRALQGQARVEKPQERRRITESVDNNRTIRLPQTTHARIRQASDNGRVDPDLPMERAVLTLKSSSEQQAELEKLLADQQDPTSPNYHHWLTPREFGERFGASTEDIAVIVNWLRSRGLRVNAVSNGRREIEFSGTARGVEEAFHMEIHHYEFNGEMHVANATDIAIPEALSRVVSGVVSLHDFVSKPKIHQLQPNLTTQGGIHYMAPYDFATIYDVAALWNQGFDGTGQAIAVVGRTNITLNDVTTFRSIYGLPPNDPQIIINGIDPGVVSPGEEGEADLDVEWSGAVARGATIKFVVSQSTHTSDGAYLSEQYIVNNNVAPILTTSFGFCEVMAPKVSLQVYVPLWQQAASQGMSVFVAAGDSGSATCDSPTSTAAQGGLSVDGEASTPYDVAVGGSQFNENGANSVYWGTNNPNRSSAKVYIPEVVWNESGPSGLWAGGGGVSTVHSTPSWQTGNGVPAVDPGTTSQHHRYVPDVSLTAAGHDGYVIQQHGNFSIVSGTSAAAPAFAGIMAIVNQVTNQANGNPNPRIYALAAQVPTAFHDVTSGTNAVPCVAGSPNCGPNGNMTGYSAGPGYDLATGWGSVDAYVFVNAFAGVVITPLTITSSSTLTSGSTGTSYTLTLTASGGTSPYSWSVASGSLPPGLSLSSSGVLSGTPDTPDSYSFTVQVTDSTGASATQNDQITITTGSSGGGPSATASTYHVFPQFADGRNPDGTYYRTTVMISNPGSGNVTCTLQLLGLTVPGFGLSYPLGPNGWTITSTTGSQNLQTGYASLQCTPTAVEAQLLYSYYAANGTKLSEATVFSSPSGSTASVVADQREGARLGLAIANDTDQTVNYSISVTGATGGPATFALPPRTSTARFIDQFVSGIPANNLGTVQVSSSSGTASVIGLRFTGNVFTTIPETMQPALPTAKPYHVFPQFADGKFSDGTYYRTTRIYINSGSSSTNCATQLYGATTDGVSTFPATNLAPGSSVVAPTSGTQIPLQSGYAALQCQSAVDAQELFSYYSASGVKLSEATVFSSPASKTVQILADTREGAQVGMAIANDSDQATTYTITVGDVTGSVVGSTQVTLQPRTATAKFLSQFVPLPANFFGQVIVSSSTGTASIIGLRYTGNVFTTIPETIRP